MFHFVIGASGAGKTHYVYQQIINASIKEPEKQFFVLVPEQASLEAQKSLVKMHPCKGIMNIDALSFMRLAHRIFAETGRNPRVALDDAGKTLVVKRVLKEHAGELGYFAANASRRGFCIEMKSVISELMQYGIDRERLSGMQELLRKSRGAKELLSKKMHDIAICYDGFKKYIEDRFIAPEEIYDLLADAVYDSAVLKNSTVALDGYTGFTPSQFRLLSALLSTCENVYITITMDPHETGRILDKHDLFYLSFKTMEQIRRLASEASCEEGEPVILPKGTEALPRFAANPAMAELESRLFANSRNKTRAKADEETLSCPVTLRSAKNPVAEVKALICEINAAIHEGLRYRDLAVITGDFERYAPIFSREFEKAGIPAFLDFRRGIMSNPVVELLRALTCIPLYGYSRQSVFRLLRCMLFETDEKATDELENYVVAMGIHGKSTWKSAWKRTWRKSHPPVLPEINRTREDVTARILSFTDILEGETTVSAKIEALRAFLASENIEERLDALCGMLSKEPGNSLLVSEYTQILPHIEEIFERMQGLIGDEIMPLKDFVELLELGFIETKVGILPQSMDCMLVGDVERSRIGRIKRLFFIGVNEGVIPQAASGSGIISDSDRTFFLENGFELSPTLREKAYTGEFYLYQNLTKPAERLYISYAENDAADSKLSPSYLVALFKRMYKGLEAVPAAKVELPEYELLSDNGRTAVLETLRDLKADMLEGGAWSEGLMAKAALLSSAVRLSRTEYEQILASVFYKSKEQKIEEETAKRLYGDFFASVSRLEDFAGCNLAHFLKYGLDLSKRREYEIQTYDLGNLCHNIIERCGRRVLEENRRFSTLSAEDCRQLVEDAAAEEFEEYENGMMHDSKRREHISKLVKNTCLRTMLTTVHQLEGGSFEPAWLEESFAVKNGDLKLYGRFDRVDICEDNGRIYVKIVDYKSSEHKVDDEKIEAGLQLQLGIYAAAAKALVKERFPDREYVPGAVFYYTMDDPIVEECENPEAKVNGELTPDGRVNADPAVIIRLDEGFKPDEDAKTELKAGYNTDKIPVKITKNGDFDKHSMVWSKERFDEITDFLVEKSKEYVDMINSGEASANPARYKKRSACRYCDFKDMCSFGSLSGKRERVIGKASPDDTGDEDDVTDEEE